MTNYTYVATDDNDVSYLYEDDNDFFDLDLDRFDDNDI